MKKNFPSKVTIYDVTVRDGLQHEEHFIPTDAKLYLVDKLIDAGVKNLEVSLMSNPKYIPQFKDYEDFLLRLPKKEDVEYTSCCLNTKAVERILPLLDRGVPVTRVSIGQLSTSEAHAKHNNNRTHKELFEEAAKSYKILRDYGMKTIIANVATIFGCPIAGKMPLEKAWEFTERLFDMGIDQVEHSDHDGQATPDVVYEYFSKCMELCPDPDKHTFHIHDTRGMGIAGYTAAMEAGITRFDCTLGGIGGQPANFFDGVPIRGTGDYYVHARRTGLVCLEDFVTMLEGMGIETGIDVEKLYALGLLTEKILGRELYSFANTAGKLNLLIKEDFLCNMKP